MNGKVIRTQDKEDRAGSSSETLVCVGERIHVSEVNETKKVSGIETERTTASVARCDNFTCRFEGVEPITFNFPAEKADKIETTFADLLKAGGQVATAYDIAEPAQDVLVTAAS